jgi:hypothetical protein
MEEISKVLIFSKFTLFNEKKYYFTFLGKKDPKELV